MMQRLANYIVLYFVGKQIKTRMDFFCIHYYLSLSPWACNFHNIADIKIISKDKLRWEILLHTLK